MPTLVNKFWTPWAEPQDHDNIVLNGFEIIRSAGITAPMQTMKALVHMIWACGWRQNCDNYNTHKIKLGSWWDGPYYLDTTEEEDDFGNKYLVIDDEWRSYNSYEEGVHNYLALLDRPHMSRAKAVFYNENASLAEFADALEDSGYWSASSADEGAIFESMGRRVRRTLEANGITLVSQTDTPDPISAPIARRTTTTSQSIAPIAGAGVGGILAIGGLIWWILAKKR